MIILNIDGRDVVIDLVLTKTGLYILPLDNICEKKFTLQAHEQGRVKIALYAENQMRGA